MSTEHRASVWAAAACAGLGCQSVSPGPPMVPLPGVPDGRRPSLGEFESGLRLTETIEQSALRRPSIDATVDAEIRSMVNYVREHGRGELAADWQTAAPSQRARNYVLRLEKAAWHLFPYLGLDSGPEELGRVAVASLGQQLGDDAAYRVEHTDTVSVTDLVLQLRDGIGFLGIRALSKEMGDRLQGIFDEWATRSPPPRAIVLDLARCELGSPSGATVLVNAFAPGRTAFELSFRDPSTGALRKKAWHGDAAVGSAVGAVVPVFVVTSSHTGAVAEAVTHALRFYRTARILGSPTSGSGRVMEWYELPWRAWFGFTVAEFVGVDGQPLHGRPLIPDACLGDQRMVHVSERTLDAYQAACPGAEREVSSAASIDYVRSLLSSESPPSPSPHL